MVLLVSNKTDNGFCEFCQKKKKKKRKKIKKQKNDKEEPQHEKKYLLTCTRNVDFTHPRSLIKFFVFHMKVCSLAIHNAPRSDRANAQADLNLY